MSKIAFSKLKLQKKEEIKEITINNNTIEVKQYLPVADKLNLIADVMNASMDDNNFMNPLKIDILTHLYIIYNYTNLSFTDKQKEDVTKLYDILETNDVISAVISSIPQEEYTNLIDDVQETIKEFHKFKNSMLGILETMTNDYSNLKIDADEIQSKISNPENLKLLKDITTKLG